jgi:hypothetical protein
VRFSGFGHDYYLDEIDRAQRVDFGPFSTRRFWGFRLFWLPGELGGSFPLVLQEGRLEVFAYLWVFSEEAFHEGWPHSMDTGPWWIEVLE